jgi:transcription elongation GreA/GreB family factor
LEVQFDNKEVVVITPQSPLGQNLIGKKVKDKWLAEVGGVKASFEIKSVV